MKLKPCLQAAWAFALVICIAISDRQEIMGGVQPIDIIVNNEDAQWQELLNEHHETIKQYQQLMAKIETLVHQQQKTIVESNNLIQQLQAVIADQQLRIKELEAQLNVPPTPGNDDDDPNTMPRPGPLPLYVAHYNVEQSNFDLLPDLKFELAYFVHMPPLIAGTDANGWIELLDEETFIARICELVPADHTGPAIFDIEGELEQAADAGDQRAIDRMLEILRRGKKARPGAQWGIYGYPRALWYPVDELRLRDLVAEACRHPIAQACEVWTPSRYEVLWGQSWTDAWTITTHRINMQVMRDASDGRLIMPIVMARYHSNGKHLDGLGDTLVEPKRFARTIKALRDHGADTVILWGHEDSTTRSYALGAFAGTWPPPNSEYYLIVSRHRSVFAHERKPQYSVDQHLEMVNAFYLRLISAVWHDNEPPPPPDVNFGPVETVLPPHLSFAFAAPHNPHEITGTTGALVLDRVKDLFYRDITIEPESKWAIKINNGQTAERIAVRNLTGVGLTEYGAYLGGARDITFAGVHLERIDNAKEHGLRIANCERIIFAKHESGRRNYVGGKGKSAIWVVSGAKVHLEAIDLGSPDKPVGAIRLGARPDVISPDGQLQRAGDRQGGIITTDGIWKSPPPALSDITICDIDHWHNGNDNHAFCIWPISGTKNIRVKDYRIRTKSRFAIHVDSRWNGTAEFRDVTVNGEPLAWHHIDTGGRPLHELQQHITIIHDDVGDNLENHQGQGDEHVRNLMSGAGWPGWPMDDRERRADRIHHALAR